MIAHANLYVRAFAVWLVIIAAETLHGALRTLALEPLVGDFRARQISVFTGSALILVVATFFSNRLKAHGAAQQLSVGFFWVALTVPFELLLGRYVMHLSWERIFSDYRLADGGLMPLGLLVLALAPLLAEKIRRAF